jgi:hypothetical protein
MTATGPARGVAGVSGDGIEGTGGRGEVDVLPPRVVEGWASPERGVGDWVERRVTGLKLPGAIEGNNAAADGDLIGLGVLGSWDGSGLGERWGGAGEGQEECASEATGQWGSPEG